jgi:hypothetical protein
MSHAQQIVAILLEDNRVCAGCQKEFGTTPAPGSSHGFCRRHYIQWYADDVGLDRIAAMPDENFSPDMAQQRQPQSA